MSKPARTVTINVDLVAGAAGFGSASRPTPAHHRLVKHYSSPFLMGPPPSELLLEMILHMFTDEEAEAAAHLPPLRPRTAGEVARRSGIPQAETTGILEHLAVKKAVIMRFGEKHRYTILPIIPGTFEMALMKTDLALLNSWHRRFAGLFERLFETGYTSDYPGAMKQPLVRYLPVDSISNRLYAAWPSDKLEEVFAPYKDFAVANCQCRIAMGLIGRGCGKPLGNCLTFGPIARKFTDRAFMRRIDLAEAIALKREAEAAGCVTWMQNWIDPEIGGGSCSCCGCCCHGLRMVKMFSTPGLLSVPHFMPSRDVARCNLCGACTRACPMDTWKLAEKVLSFDRRRCIGCGLCVVSCKPGALVLQPVPDAYTPPARYPLRKSFMTMAPVLLKNGIFVWAKRAAGRIGIG